MLVEQKALSWMQWWEFALNILTCEKVSANAGGKHVSTTGAVKQEGSVCKYREKFKVLPGSLKITQQ